MVLVAVYICELGSGFASTTFSLAQLQSQSFDLCSIAPTAAWDLCEELSVLKELEDG